MPIPFDLANQQPTQEPSAPRRLSSWLEEKFGIVGQPLGQAAGNLAGGIARYVAPSQEDAWRQGVSEAVASLPRTFAEAAPFMMRRAPVLRAAGLADVALRSFAGTPPEATAPQKLGATALNTA